MLWRALRNHQVDGYGFRRQTPIGPYFADFVCLARKVVVEADGPAHETADAKISVFARRFAKRDALPFSAKRRLGCGKRVWLDKGSR